MGSLSLTRTMKMGMWAVKAPRSGLVRRISSRWRDERVVMWLFWEEVCSTSMGDVLFGAEIAILRSD